MFGMDIRARTAKNFVMASSSASAAADESILIDSPEALGYIARLRHVWTALGIPEFASAPLLKRHCVPGQPLLRSAAKIESAVALWTKVAGQIVEREELVLAFMLFEEQPPIWEESSDPAQVANGPPAAWLLKRQRARERHQKRLSDAEVYLLETIEELEAQGDIVWFQGEPYRAKLRDDRRTMMHHAIHVERVRAEERAINGPFAPPVRFGAPSPRRTRNHKGSDLTWLDFLQGPSASEPPQMYRQIHQLRRGAPPPPRQVAPDDIVAIRTELVRSRLAKRHASM